MWRTDPEPPPPLATPPDDGLDLDARIRIPALPAILDLDPPPVRVPVIEAVERLRRPGVPRALRVLAELEDAAVLRDVVVRRDGLGGITGGLRQRREVAGEAPAGVVEDETDRGPHPPLRRQVEVLTPDRGDDAEAFRHQRHGVGRGRSGLDGRELLGRELLDLVGAVVQATRLRLVTSASAHALTLPSGRVEERRDAASTHEATDDGSSQVAGAAGQPRGRRARESTSQALWRSTDFPNRHSPSTLPSGAEERVGFVASYLVFVRTP